MRALLLALGLVACAIGPISHAQSTVADQAATPAAQSAGVFPASVSQGGLVFGKVAPGTAVRITGAEDMLLQVEPA